MVFICFHTQILKCDRPQCCSPMRSKLKSVFRGGWLPPPLLVAASDSGATVDKSGHFGRNLAQRVALDDSLLETFTRTGIVVNEKLTIPCSTLAEASLRTPFDLHCPSVISKLHSRICGKCWRYHASAAMLTAHKKRKFRGCATAFRQAACDAEDAANAESDSETDTDVLVSDDDVADHITAAADESAPDIEMLRTPEDFRPYVNFGDE